MTAGQIAQKIAEIELVNPFTEDTYLHISYDRNYVGSLRKILPGENGRVILSSAFSTDDGDYPSPEDLSVMLQTVDPSSEVYYNCPSMGSYEIVSITRRTGDWGDGDGPYDYIDIVCSREPFEGPVNESVKKTSKRLHEKVTKLYFGSDHEEYTDIIVSNQPLNMDNTTEQEANSESGTYVVWADDEDIIVYTKEEISENFPEAKEVVKEALENNEPFEHDGIPFGFLDWDGEDEEVRKDLEKFLEDPWHWYLYEVVAESEADKDSSYGGVWFFFRNGRFTPAFSSRPRGEVNVHYKKAEPAAKSFKGLAGSIKRRADSLGYEADVDDGYVYVEDSFMEKYEDKYKDQGVPFHCVPVMEKRGDNDPKEAGYVWILKDEADKEKDDAFAEEHMWVFKS